MELQPARDLGTKEGSCCVAFGLLVVTHHPPCQPFAFSLRNVPGMLLFLVFFPAVIFSRVHVLDSDFVHACLFLEMAIDNTQAVRTSYTRSASNEQRRWL